MHATERHWDAEVIKLLLAEKADVYAKSEGMTALMFAVKANNIEAVKVLAAVRDTLNLKDSQGRTALYLAGENRDNYEMIMTLAKAGADVDAFKKGEFALDYALNSGNKEIADVLRAEVIRLREGVRCLTWPS